MNTVSLLVLHYCNDIASQKLQLCICICQSYVNIQITVGVFSGHVVVYLFDENFVSDVVRTVR